MSSCTVDPLGTGNPSHSDDLVEVYHGRTTPALMCGFHATHWPELASQAVHGSTLDNDGEEAQTSSSPATA